MAHWDVIECIYPLKADDKRPDPRRISRSTRPSIATCPRQPDPCHQLGSIEQLERFDGTSHTYASATRKSASRYKPNLRRRYSCCCCRRSLKDYDPSDLVVLVPVGQQMEQAAGCCLSNGRSRPIRSHRTGPRAFDISRLAGRLADRSTAEDLSRIFLVEP